MSSTPTKTTLAPFLSVRNGAKAVDFYKSAFGAEELFRHEDPTGAVVCNLAINGYGFWVADEAPEYKNFSPETLNGGTVRMILTTEDPDGPARHADGPPNRSPSRVTATTPGLASATSSASSQPPSTRTSPAHRSPRSAAAHAATIAPNPCPATTTPGRSAGGRRDLPATQNRR